MATTFNVRGWLWGGNIYEFRDARVDSLSAVASSGSYNDLTDKPSIPSIEGLQEEHKTATVTLTSSGWSNLAQTVAVAGVTAGNTVYVSPAPSSTEAWGKAGVYASAQAYGTLTFACKKAPAASLTANIAIFN